MKIEILGTGCAKCQALTLHVKEAVAKKGIFAQIEKVEDIMKNYGVRCDVDACFGGRW